MLAQYMAVDDKILNEMRKLDSEDIIDMIEELSENEDCDICDIDKMWKALHFFLTGNIINLQLDKGVFGKKFTKEKIEEHLAYIKCEELPQIVEALESVDIEECKKERPFKTYEENKIYPNIWKNVEAEDFFDEMEFCYEGLLEFYKKCIERKLNVIVSIY